LSGFTESKTPAQDPGSLDKAIANLCSGSRKFQAGFSNAQRDGLKRTTRSLDKTTAELEQQAHRYGQSAEAPQVSIIARTLADFYDENLVLGREMSIVPASDQDVRFSLPAVRSSASMGSATVVVNSLSVLSQTSASGALKTFRLSTTVDLSGLQQVFSEALGSELDHPTRCERRLSLRQATIMGASPASSAVLQLHFERWSCHGMGQGSPMEIAEGDGTVEIRLTPVVDRSNNLGIESEIRRVEAVGMLHDELKSGDLGSDLREKVGTAVLTVVNTAINNKTTLPSALQNPPTLLSARFEELGTGGLNLIAERQLQLSGDQITALAAQLNQTRNQTAKNP